MNDGLGIVKRYVDDVNVGIEFNQLIDSNGHEIIAEVYVLGSDALAGTVTTGTPTLAGKAGNRKKVQCDFHLLPSAGNYILKFRTEESGVLATAPLVLFGDDAFSVGDDLETETYPIVDFTLADRIALDSIGTKSFRGYYNAATNTPNLDVSPIVIYSGYAWSVSVAGTFFTEPVEVGDLLTANVDNPTTLADWTISQANLDEQLYMSRAQYDPNAVEGDVFDMDNMVEGSDTKIMTGAERTKLGHIAVTQAVDLDTIETNVAASKVKTDHITVTQPVDLDAIETNSNASKVKTDLISITQPVDLDALETEIAALANGMVYKGDWDASAGTFPGAGAAQIGWFYYVSVGGTVNGISFAIGDNIVAIVDNASTGTYAGNWSKHDQTDAVSAVVGQTGSVTAAQIKTALEAESDTNFLTDAEQTKLAGIDAKIKTGTASGTDTYALTVSNYAAYTALDIFVVTFTNANTGSATLNVNSIGAIALKKNATEALASGDIVAGAELICVYDGTNFQVIGISNNKLFETIALSDETSDLSTGQSIYSYLPKVNGNWTSFRIYVDTAPTGSTIIVDIKKNGTTIFSTKLTIDAGETSSTTAAAAAVISTAAFTTTDEITVHIDQVGSTIAGTALKLDMYFTRTS
jgi:hypothetical protein